MAAQAISTTFSVLINARPEDVFAYVSDLSRHGEWNAGLRIEPVTGGPVAVGKEYRTVGQVAGQDRQNLLRLTEIQSPARFAFAAQDPTFGQVLHEFSFRPQNAGTRVERRVTLHLAPLMAIVFRSVIRPLIGRPAMERSHQALKAKLEQPGGRASR